MSNLKEISDKWLNKQVKGLGDNYDQLGLKASGKWKKSLEPFYSDKSNRISLGVKGEHYSEYLENGRRPNEKNTPKNWRGWATWATSDKFEGGGFISKWAKDKGIGGNAFGIAYNIAKNGWYNKGGLVSNVINKKAIDELAENLSLHFIESVSSDIRNILK